MLQSNLQYKSLQNPKLTCFSSRQAVVLVQSIEARCKYKSEDLHVVGAAPTCDASSIWVIYNFIAYRGASYALEVWR